MLSMGRLVTLYYLGIKLKKFPPTIYWFFSWERNLKFFCSKLFAKKICVSYLFLLT